MNAPGSAKLPGPGDVVDGKYRLERLLGQGGMGAVYAARHVKLGHAVAIKLMLEAAGNVEATRRFLNEGRAAVNIQHDNVVRGTDLGEEHGYAFMVLELLDGEDLDQLLEREIRLAPHVAVNYAIQACRGISQAHAQGIIHRDLKPANLFLAKRPDGSTLLKVLDFGISKTTTGSALDMAPGQLTSTATMLGSPLYMSPEQLRSSKKVDARADIWAMGVILYELMSGERPFNGETLGELFSAILETEAPRLSTRVPSVPPGLDSVVARCLQRRPEDRYATVAELERELAPFAVANGPATGSALAFSAVAHPRHFSPSTGPNLAPDGPPGGRAVTGSAGAVSGPYPPMANTNSNAAMARSSPSVGGAPSAGMMLGTVPLGMMSPASFQQTTGSGSAWQSTSPPRAPPASKAPLTFALVCGALALVGGGLLTLRYVKKDTPTATGATSAVAAPAASTVAASTVAAPAASTSAAAPAETTVALPASEAPSARAVPTAAPPSASTGAAPVRKTSGAPVVAAPKASDTPSPVDPPIPVDAPKPTPRPLTKPTPTTAPATPATGLQNSR